uniref:YebF family protein n=3 Tax=Escherichia coli TaxID=562 RepID=UPI0024E22313|nr:YebF family protein [Escherichia coli]WHH21542.1 YebF family protein [Escherichia coli]
MNGLFKLNYFMVINMKRNSMIKTSITIIIVAIIAFLFSEYRDNAEAKNCNDISNTQARQDVKSHFMNFLSRAISLQQELGTTDIMFTWGDINREKDNKSELLGINFSAKGHRGEKHFIALYTCSNGKIEYSVVPEDDVSPSGSNVNVDQNP